MPAISIIIIGITAMASQIIFMRELLIVFYGSELSIGFILASWLMGGAIGSAFFGRFTDRINYKTTTFGILQTFLAISLPLEIIAIRSIKGVLGISPGQIIPLFPMALSSFTILVPICALLGFLFSLACRIYKSVGSVYVLEGVGAVIGGTLAGSILIRFVNPISITAMLSILNIAASLAILYFSEDKRFKRAAFVFTAAIFIVMSSISIFRGWDNLERRSLKEEWSGYELIASKNSVYGNIILTKRADQFSFFDNGLILYAIPDKARSEESVHLALLEHPEPRDVLLVGGGVGGLVEEILKHPIDRLDYVELDPLIIKMAGSYLPEKYSSPLRDKKVGIENIDGRFFIKTTPRRYDCIIMDVGDPYTAQLNRYYTYEFFEEAKGALKMGGIISFGVTSSENYINKELGDLLRSIYATLKKSFKDVLVIPGDTAYFLATNNAGLLTHDYNAMMERARSRKIDLQYVREYYLSSRMSPQRMANIEGILKSGAGGAVNHDLRPLSYYYDTLFWTTRFRDSIFTKVLKGTDEKTIWLAIFAIYGLVLLFGSIAVFGKKPFERMVIVSLGGAGFSGMAVQVIILLAFQIIYGYLFYKLSVILTAFMVGLVAGGWLSITIIPKLKSPGRAFILTQCAFFIYPLALPLLFRWLGNSGARPVAWLGQDVIFTLLPIAAGFIGGFQFPLASKIYMIDAKEAGGSAGLTYGTDLAGSCLGALFTGAFLIPVLGIPESCLALAGLNLVIMAMLIFSFRRDKV
jgi:spermidine synthase